MRHFYRPLVQTGQGRPPGAVDLTGGPCWFTHVEVLMRGTDPKILPAEMIPAEALERLTAKRPAIGALSFERPLLMGILNVTPDSFSDGGVHVDPVASGVAGAGADVIDIGGESTRPGADFIPAEVEIGRVAPVIEGLRAAGVATPISIDTRKAAVAEAALSAGANLVNDVSGFTFDEALAPLCAARKVPVCVMHAQGDPTTMQNNPRYDDVLLDVYEYLDQQIQFLEWAGVPRAQIIVDPGIGFGKTMQHNLALLHRISLFHSLGCVVLLGASRKRFIGTIGQAPDAQDRAAGSIAVGLAALAQGVHILRVHDVAETRQAWHCGRQ